MRDKVLYFPYIRVPDSTWFTRILLYWDEVGTIVPYEFIEAPERLGEHTRSLVQAGLVKQVIPGIYIPLIPRFAEAFLGYLDRLGSELDRRRSAFRKGETFRIHIEKMDSLTYPLMDLGLAQASKPYPWLDVEERTARDFMGYLATVLGRLKELDYAPTTDEEGILESLALAGAPSSLGIVRLAALRLVILEEALPAPSGPLHASEIRAFKDTYGEELRRFRRYIERELTSIAAVQDTGLCEHRLQILKEEIHDETASIRSRMEDRGWTRLIFGRLCSLLAPILGRESLPALIKSVYEAFSGEVKSVGTEPLAYAAFAQQKLLLR